MSRICRILVVCCWMPGMVSAAPVANLVGASTSGAGMEVSLDDARVLRQEGVAVAKWQPNILFWPAAEGRAKAQALDAKACAVYSRGTQVRVVLCGANADALIKHVLYIPDYPAMLQSPGSQVLKCIKACQEKMPYQLRMDAPLPAY